MAFYPLYANTQHEKCLAVPAWFPFNWKDRDTVYQMLFTLQCVGQFNLTNIYGVSDTLIMCLLLITGKQLELLGCNFQNCVYNTLLQLGISKTTVLEFSFNHDGEYRHQLSKKSKINTNLLYLLIKTDKFQKLLQLNLHECVRHHQEILAFIRRLEKFIWPILTIKIVSSMFYHILICFVIVCNANRTFFYTLGQYEVMAVYELLLFSYFGQYLVTKGQHLQTQVYACPWYINQNAFMKSFLIALKGCQRYPYLSIAKITPLTLATFLSIMKTSTSYFTVLRQTIEK
ncbi:hypothetical protein RN001_007027 [Aquatica leii]|uniref:Uncharacterized protein n=1 Tax=Aquatica leii TaxID=1421715 RepID=A0AAN7SQE7_9COLE|nr:hypothetical protein RN001_007027 [Aquatica leii]